VARNVARGVVNTLATIGAVLLYVFLAALFASVATGSSGDGQVSGRLQVYVVPLLVDCLAAALAGAALGLALVRTGRPSLYGALLGGGIVLYHCASTTVVWRNLDPESFGWIALAALLPALVGTVVAGWLAHKRRPAADRAVPARDQP
jgi:hypothetical protein